MRQIFITILCLSSLVVIAQDDIAWGYTYEVSFPMGETNDYISKASFRGFAIQGRKFVKSNLSVGVSFGWHVFHERSTESTDFVLNVESSDQNIAGTFTGKQYRYLNAFPMTVNAFYYSGAGIYDDFAIYGGLGVGTIAIVTRTEIGVFELKNTNWHFGITPEIGVAVSTTAGVKLLAGLKYSHAFETNSSGNQSYLSANVGMVRLF